MDFDRLTALTPIDCFALEVPLKKCPGAVTQAHMKNSFLLPVTTDLLGEEAFAEVACAWNEEGLYITLFSSLPFQGCSYPQFETGDAFELFVDTRDLKTVATHSRFCHHFLFLPKMTEGILGLELSRFRAEESHPLADPSDFTIEYTDTKKTYTLFIKIPAQALYGYDPTQIKRLGMTYRIHRTGGKPQHFAISSCDYALEQYPKLWASFSLIDTGAG